MNKNTTAGGRMAKFVIALSFGMFAGYLAAANCTTTNQTPLGGTNVNCVANYATQTCSGGGTEVQVVQGSVCVRNVPNGNTGCGNVNFNTQRRTGTCTGQPPCTVNWGNWVQGVVTGSAANGGNCGAGPPGPGNQ